MNQAVSTKEKLLHFARELFWTRGYSNVSVRDITNAAGVDASLVSRYYGGKQGLFEATLAEIPKWEALSVDRERLLATAVESFSHPFDPERDQANPFTMLLANIIDPEMSGKVRELVRQHMAEPLGDKIGGPGADDRAAMLLAALFGMALMRKNFQLDTLTKKSPDEISDQLMHLAKAAFNFDQ